MVEVTVQLPESLANRIKPLGVWMPALMEIALAGFRTRAAQVAADLIGFLEKNPLPKDVLLYRASKKSNDRLNRLMALSEAGVLSAEEKCELRELEKLEHIVVMLKAQAGRILKES
ncbi:MAG: hypothetical protein R2747_23420 [Pyrinomonadaceae bacterium]